MLLCSLCVVHYLRRIMPFLTSQCAKYVWKLAKGYWEGAKTGSSIRCGGYILVLMVVPKWCNLWENKMILHCMLIFQLYISSIRALSYKSWFHMAWLLRHHNDWRRWPRSFLHRYIGGGIVYGLIVISMLGFIFFLYLGCVHPAMQISGVFIQNFV